MIIFNWIIHYHLKTHIIVTVCLRLNNVTDDIGGGGGGGGGGAQWYRGLSFKFRTSVGKLVVA